VTGWLTDVERSRLRLVLDSLLPDDGTCPGAGAVGGVEYVDRVLGAFQSDPPTIFAGGPFSGRRGGDASFDEWIPLSRSEELAWRTRIEGSNGIAEREFNGPVVGWQQIYRDGLAALGDDFESFDSDGRRASVAANVVFARLAFEHACESLYGDPVYGGNRDQAGWAAIGFDGDVQPRGWTDDEVTYPLGRPDRHGATPGHG